MSTCNWLELQTLGSQPIMPKNLPNHWAKLGNTRMLTDCAQNSPRSMEMTFIVDVPYTCCGQLPHSCITTIRTWDLCPRWNLDEHAPANSLGDALGGWEPLHSTLKWYPDKQAHRTIFYSTRETRKASWLETSHLGNGSTCAVNPVLWYWHKHTKETA